MKKTIKKFISTILVLVAIVSSGFAVNAAAANSYESTYEMYGGVTTRNMKVSKSGYIHASLYPTKGVANANITLYLLTSGGSSVKSRSVSSEKNSTTKFINLDKNTYKIYMRNYTGQLMKGDCKFEYQ